MSNKYNEVLKFVIESHRGQFRDDGVTEFVIHPIRISHIINDDYKLKYVVVAMLHDVVEDSKDKEIIGKVVELIRGLYVTDIGTEILEALDAITQKPNEDKHEYYKRVAKNEIAATVKIYDRIDNLTDMEGSSQTRIYKYAKDSECLCHILKETKWNFEFSIYRNKLEELEDIYTEIISNYENKMFDEYYHKCEQFIKLPMGYETEVIIIDNNTADDRFRVFYVKDGMRYYFDWGDLEFKKQSIINNYQHCFFTDIASVKFFMAKYFKLQTVE